MTLVYFHSEQNNLSANDAGVGDEEGVVFYSGTHLTRFGAQRTTESALVVPLDLHAHGRMRSLPVMIMIHMHVHFKLCVSVSNAVKQKCILSELVCAKCSTLLPISNKTISWTRHQ